MRSRIGSLLALGLLLSVPSGARSNDSAFGGFGADLFPVDESRVQMAAEHIQLSWLERSEPGDSAVPVRQPGWEVEARYVFRNLSSEPVTVRMGFPEMLCVYSSPEDCAANGGRFEGLSTTVRGQRVEHSVGRATGRPAEELELGLVHLFAVDFEPEERVEITHRYRVTTFGLMDYERTLLYLTRTGAFWAGNIGEARFTIRVPTRPWSVAWRQGFDFISEAVVESAEGRTLVELVFVARDWDASTNFVAAFGRPFMAYRHDEMEGWARDYPITNVLVSSADDEDSSISDRPSHELHRILHHLDAHRGREFESARLNAAHFGEPRQVVEIGGNIVLGGGFNTVGHRISQDWRRMPVSSREQQLRDLVLSELRSPAR